MDWIEICTYYECVWPLTMFEYLLRSGPQVSVGFQHTFKMRRLVGQYGFWLQVNLIAKSRGAHSVSNYQTPRVDKIKRFRLSSCLASNLGRFCHPGVLIVETGGVEQS
jgi:hypothetical protein